ncbi:uncharacterized protein PgNI_06947 [Pyricularia grisea]|uniref:Uncharacterized protein n=1 Tax=Pyricularia grisea TaxID=148305 RepID=A0A6P8B303_PYRGI|nr:uncharacterized protein PgNI_06947 [Pyricularia grisea]TLD09290.1 hypothetical protein PgNI_06947 [Pyricularia grisea]
MLTTMHSGYRSYTHRVGAFNHTTPLHLTDARRGPVIPCLWGPYRYVLCLIPVILQQLHGLRTEDHDEVLEDPVANTTMAVVGTKQGFPKDGQDVCLHGMTEVPVRLLRLLECVASSDLQGTSFGS